MYSRTHKYCNQNSRSSSKSFHGIVFSTSLVSSGIVFSTSSDLQKWKNNSRKVGKELEFLVVAIFMSPTVSRLLCHICFRVDRV